MLTIKTTRQQLVAIIEATRNCFMSVIFIKKDGTKRKLHGMRGVKKYLHGTGNKPTVSMDKFFIFYELRNGYRAVNKETIMEATFNKTHYIVEN